MQNESNVSYPLTVSKSQLAQALSISTDTMRRTYLTPQVVETVLNITMQEYKRIIVFDVVKTRALIQFFEIKPEQFLYTPKSHPFTRKSQ